MSPMVHGTIDADGAPRIPLRFLEPPGDISAIVDTAFSEALWLPVDNPTAQDIPIAGVDHASLADGSAAVVAVGEATIEWLGRERRIEVLLTGSGDALLGRKLMEGCQLLVDFRQGRVRLSSEDHTGSSPVEPQGRPA